MDSKPPRLSESGRDVAISRRGGVKTRGGRLPPIRMRDIAQVMGTKKVVAPNIPQRRVVVKKEKPDGPAECVGLKCEPEGDFRQRKSRPAKVILQTDGTYLSEGPAARIKRDPIGQDLGFFATRASAAKGPECAAKYDPEMIKDVLDSYEDNQFYVDDIGEMPPYRLPLLKQKPSELECGIKIKKEIVEDDETAEVKTEPTKALEYFQNVKSEGMLILLKLPTCLPFLKKNDDAECRDGLEEDGKEVEGRVGRLRFLRSGRMLLLVGGAELELLDDVPSESYMEAASLRVQGDQADLVVIGKVGRRMVLKPLVHQQSPPSK